jgi:pyruvate/2-oxoglutarate dehydrogenase complex dihydrolipoamide dehydrogenase (E3) component
MATEVDVVVLGLGPGGEHAAIELGRAGLEVLAIEERLVGGECPYYGCVPSKMMIAAANALREARRVGKIAGSAEIHPDWSPVARRIRDEATDDWDDAVAVQRLQDSGVTFVRGRGHLTGPRAVEVGGTTYVARRGVVLNTGTAPAVPPIKGIDRVDYWTNREVVRLTELPASVAIIGGGAIGCEFAQVFAQFGTTVTVVEGADRLVSQEEPEASEQLLRAFRGMGIEVVTGTEVQEVSRDRDGLVLSAGADCTIRAEQLLVATGRRTNLADIGLGNVGLDPQAKTLEPDERMCVAEGLWAVGDITGKGAFTHVSLYQADIVVRDLLGQDGPGADYRAESRVTFTTPEVAAVGQTEAQARDAGVNVRVATGDLGARGWLAKEDGLVKIVLDADRDVVVGATVVGPAGGESNSMLVTAIQAEVPLSTLRQMHFAYPTYHRAIQTVLDRLG